ncbi:MAG: hypothetical protein M3271_09245, partial [Actinomycetota bacterium]|nr:hypothetical protein [Actinomycetota bacterium]
MPDASIVVPVQLDALVVNDGVVSSKQQFRDWPFNYAALDIFHSPTPEPSSVTGARLPEGIHLHWVLPQALRVGSGGHSGAVEYPLVPNRWLVARFGSGAARSVAAWVVESDCPTSPTAPGRTSPPAYLVDPDVLAAWARSGDPRRNKATITPYSSGLKTAEIGLPFDLSGWSEQAAEEMFLTAVAPGDPLFSVYYAHSRGAFGFYDDVAGIASGCFSYLVVGWYSDPSRDVIASWSSASDPDAAYADLLASLMWDVAGDVSARATRSFYEGTTSSVDWDRSGAPPGQAHGTATATDPLQLAQASGVLDVAIGNNTLDAFAALIERQLEAKGYDAQTIALLRAFEYDLLPLANQVNGQALIDRKVHDAWFGSSAGGYSWVIVAADGGTAAGDTSSDESWLCQLNADQASLDAALGVLADLQWQLNALWWKNGRYPQVLSPDAASSVTSQQMRDLLDPTKEASLARRVLDQIDVMKTASAKVPQPQPTEGLTPQEALEQGIQAFASTKGLPGDRRLKAVPAPRYRRPSDPAIVISGVDPPAELSPQATLQVRATESLVTAIHPAGYPSVSAAAAAALAPAIANLAALPPEVTALVQEFALLDPGNSGEVASAIGAPPQEIAAAMRSHAPDIYTGTLPAFGLAPWTQPWSPMFVEFSLRYTHVPFGGNGNSPWSFDGDDYHYSPGPSDPPDPPRSAGGIALLGPHSQFVFAARLKDFARKYGTSGGLGAVEEHVEAIDGWKFLAQELTGFGELLTGRDARPYRRPVATDEIRGDEGPAYAVADLVGYPDAGTGSSYSIADRYRGRVTSIPYLPGDDQDPPPSYGTRSGQAYVEMLYLYDKFGRVLWVVAPGRQSGLHDAANFPAIVDKALAPRMQVDSGIASVAELPPRVLQPARLDVAFVDAADPSKVLGIDAGVNPVGGWLLPNHLENSVLLYGPDGRGLGEFRLTATATGAKTGHYAPPPHGDISHLSDVVDVAPRVADVFGAAAVADASAFAALLDVIDSTLWTTDPLGSRSDQDLSVLVGRPLALVHVRLRLSLDGPPIRATGWDATIDPPEPVLPSYGFSVRLGDQATRDDGLIGYFLGGPARGGTSEDVDYSRFNSVVAPASKASQSYVVPIGSATAGGTANYFQLQFSPSSYADLLLLVDPRAGVHVTTGILPVRRFQLPAAFVQPALETVEVAFRIGPALTSERPTPVQAGQTPPFSSSIAYPLPAEQNGTWSWWQTDGAGAPTGFGLV